MAGTDAPRDYPSHLGATPEQVAAGINSAGGRGALAESMGVEIVRASPAEVVATMPVEGNTQPYGILHGGASVVLAETVGSIAGFLHGQTLTARDGVARIAMGIEVSAAHHKPAASGHVTATARAVSLGRTLVTYDIEIVNGDGQRTCTARLTCLIREQG